MTRLAKLWTLNFILISFVSLCNSMAFQGLNVAMPLYIDKLGGSLSMAGLAIAVLTAAAVIVRPFTGLALDVYGRRLILAGGLVLIMLPSLVYIFMVPFSVLLVLRFIQGLGWGISHTTAGTVASDIVPAVRLAEGMGSFNVASSISSALSPLISIWLINKFSFRTFFVVIFVLMAASMAFSQTVRYPELEADPQHHRFELIQKEALRPALVVLFMSIGYSSVVSFLALFTRDSGISNPGVFFVSLGLATMVSRPLSGRLLDRLGNRGYDLAVIISAPFLVISLWIISQINASWQLAVSGIVFGLGAGTVMSAMLTMCIKRLPGKRGSANAMYGTFLDTGIAAGSVIWGIVARFAGFEIMFRLAAIPIMLSLLVYFFKRDSEILKSE